MNNPLLSNATHFCCFCFCCPAHCSLLTAYCQFEGRSDELNIGDDELFDLQRRVQALETAEESIARGGNRDVGRTGTAEEASRVGPVEDYSDSDSESSVGWSDDEEKDALAGSASHPGTDGVSASAPIYIPSSASVATADATASSEELKEAMMDDLVAMAASLKTEATSFGATLKDQVKVRSHALQHG